MVQESTNTFSEGLVKDLNPLTTPNTVLTDALNATLLTYNGNELVLQNDMGNTKITGAKLPEGYVPIGIKEYGGILYIVSFNGTKIEIGSFPSPEIINSSLDNINPLNLNVFTNEINHNINKNIKLSKSSFKSGDDFLIILNTIKDEYSTGKEFISDYNTRKIYKPKLISISNGIELDITNDLIKQKNINNNPDYYSWFVDDSLLEADINRFELNELTQIYKSRKSGDIYVRFDLETVDEFYLNNSLTNISSYPVISKDEYYHLNFSFYIKHDSYIKCNEIKLKYSYINLNNGKTSDITTLVKKIAFPFIYGLTYAKGIIVYDNKIYYKALSLNTNKNLNDSLIWDNLGIYTHQLSIDESLIPYSLNNQYNNVFDINLGDSRNKLITYEITPRNSLFDLTFNNFTITDTLDLSKDNISWVLSPYWEIIPEYYSCEEDSINIGFNSGYKLYNVLGRFGKNSLGQTVQLDSNDLELQESSKQAIIIREGTSHVDYNNFDIIGTYTLNELFNPIFESGLIVQLPEETEFREFDTINCPQGFTMTIDYNYNINSDILGMDYNWPVFMVDLKAPTNEMKNSAKQNSQLNVVVEITSQNPLSGDFGNIMFVTFVDRIIEWWDWNGSTWVFRGTQGLDTKATASTINKDNNNDTVYGETGLDRFMITPENENEVGIIKFKVPLINYEYDVVNPEKFLHGNPVVNATINQNI